MTGDPRVMHLRQFGQNLYVPNVSAWGDILREGQLNGGPVPMPEWVARWVAEYGPFEVAALGVRKLENFAGQPWFLLPLLYIGQKYLRVHFENVICEHCQQRCGPSATPDTVAYAGTDLSNAVLWAEFSNCPVRRCPHCGGVLARRQTIWLAADGSAT